ncbi:MAG: PIN domain-containing protein [Archaeoglobaceae archaeon]
MDIFLDTSFAVSLIIKTEKTEKAREFFRIADNLVTSLSVYEETFYIGLKLLADKRLGIKSLFLLREYIRKNGYDFASDFITSLDELFSKINLLNDTKDLGVVRDIAIGYKILSNDALIAATCRHYGIRKIATFDEDFKRVDFLEVLEL